MKVAISNFSLPVNQTLDFRSYWAHHVMPPKKPRLSLFEQKVDWGFHIYAPGVYMLDKEIADEVEFWDYSIDRSTSYHSNGVLRVLFHNEEDLKAYLDRYGYPDLYINHGRNGRSVLRFLEGKCFRVFVPALRMGAEDQGNSDAECYLVDDEKFLDSRSMLYIPVVNTTKIFPIDCEKKRDFIYLASLKPSKRHDIILDAVRGNGISGHFHPVDGSNLDLSETKITTTNLNETDVVDLLRTSRIAVYPGDHTSNPAAMWECVAAGLPIVMNRKIEGGKHLVIPGITGEFADEINFRDVILHVLKNLSSYSPRKYFEDHWNTIEVVESYLSFFAKMGWAMPH